MPRVICVRVRFVLWSAVVVNDDGVVTVGRFGLTAAQATRRAVRAEARRLPTREEWERL